MIEKRIELFKRYELHQRQSDEIRLKFQAMVEELAKTQRSAETKLVEIRNELNHCQIELRTIQAESSILDRLIDQSQTKIIDSADDQRRTISFVDETRQLFDLFQAIESQVR